MPQSFIHPHSAEGENPKFKMMSTALAHLVLSVGGGVEVPAREITEMPAGELLCSYDQEGALQLVYDPSVSLAPSRAMDERYRLVSIGLSAMVIGSGGGIRIAPEAIAELPEGDLHCTANPDGTLALVFQRQQ
jgi:hypothetical protein